MTRTILTFGQALTFARAVEADYVDASGATVAAAVDAPRLTRAGAAGHAQLGLLVEGHAQNGAPDIAQVASAPAAWSSAPTDQRRTVLHHWYEPDGTERFDCHFTDDPRTAFDGLLRHKGVHAQVHSFAFLPTDIDDVTGDPPGLTRAGDAVSWVGLPGQAWTVQSAELASAANDVVQGAVGDDILTGENA